MEMGAVVAAGHEGSSGPLSAIWAWNSSAPLCPAKANQVGLESVSFQTLRLKAKSCWSCGTVS